MREAEAFLGEHPWYNSREIRSQQRVLADIAWEQGWYVLDARDAVVQRPDVHLYSSSVDCLHMNPVLPIGTHWVALLQNLLEYC